MSDYSEMKQCAQDQIDGHETTCDPAAVLALIAENERLTAELDCPFRLARHSKRLVEQLREDNEALRAQIQRQEVVELANFDWDAEMTAMRKDSERLDWLTAQGEIEQPGQGDVRGYIDAAMGKGEQS